MDRVIGLAPMGGRINQAQVNKKTYFRICDAIASAGFDKNLAGIVNADFRKQHPEFHYRLLKQIEVDNWGWYAEIAALKALHSFIGSPTTESAAQGRLFPCISAAKRKKTERLKKELIIGINRKRLTEYLEEVDVVDLLEQVDEHMTKLEAENAKLAERNSKLFAIFDRTKTRFDNGRFVVRVPAVSRSIAA